MHKIFIDYVKEQGNNALKFSHSTQKDHFFDDFSYSRNCVSCDGYGKVKCSSCGGSGKRSCYTCSGSGRVLQSRTVYDSHGNPRSESYYAYCYECSGSGKKLVIDVMEVVKNL